MDTLAVLGPEGLDALIRLLGRDRRVVGPTVRDGVIAFDDVATADDLALGWTDEQGPGHYRLHPGGPPWFRSTVGPQGAKRLLHPPRRRLWRAVRDGAAVRFEPEDPPIEPLALVGVRPCDVAAIGVLDRVLRGGDPDYDARRAAVFLVAVDCAAPAATCFCASMGTGPHAAGGFDLALTELLDDDGHRFVVRAGSEAGRLVLAQLGGRAPTEADLAAVAAQEAAARAAQVRVVDTDGLPEVLDRVLESPRWDDVATRCLACANCTLVCPTCFCHTVQDTTDLSGAVAERWQQWDSCFTSGFSHLHGGPVRMSTYARYRQWLTHKLGTWVAQFGQFGCVGCGRCITWCPVGIDITAEVARLRAYDTAVHTQGGST